jgi:signal recognition particle subunit SEC65
MAMDHTYLNSTATHLSLYSTTDIHIDTGYSVYDVPGDGNCFFHCLSLAMHGRLTDARAYRHLICSNILETWNHWEEKVQLHHKTSMTKHTYWGSMLRHNGWATICEVEAAAEHFGCKINVWLKTINKRQEQKFTLTTLLPQNDDSYNFTVDLLLNNNHFQLLRAADSVTAMPTEHSYAKSFKRKSASELPVNSSQSERKRCKNNKLCQSSSASKHISENEETADDNQPGNTGVQPEPVPENETPKQADNRRRRILYNMNKQDENIRQRMYRRNKKQKQKNTACQLLERECAELGLQCETVPDNETPKQAKRRMGRISRKINTHKINIVKNSSTNCSSNTTDVTSCPDIGHTNNGIPETEHVIQPATTAPQNTSISRDTTDVTQYQMASTDSCPDVGHTNDGIPETAQVIQPATTAPPNTSNSSADTLSVDEDVCTTDKAKHLEAQCRKLGLHYEQPPENEAPEQAQNRKRRIKNKIKVQKSKLQIDEKDIPEAPPLLPDDAAFNRAMDSIRAFELKQMSYDIKHCIVCHERRLDMSMSSTNDVCKRCFRDREPIKMFSSENNMDPGNTPQELMDLTMVEQQLISKISPCINVHMLKHGGIASSGHCVTFPQEVNEPGQIFPRLPQEIQIIRVRKQGKNNTSKEFRVRRFKVQHALVWLKSNNPAFSDIIISQERLEALPTDGEIENINTVEYAPDTVHGSDKGPAPEQMDLGDIDSDTHSSVLLPEPAVNIRERVETVVADVVGNNNVNVQINRQGTVTIPWPTRSDIPISEFTTRYFFTMAFPYLFPYGTGDFHVNRPRTCTSLADWADHLIWYQDGRFAHHQYFKFVVHNMIMRKRAFENSSFIVKQQLGEDHITISDLREQIQNGDNSVAKKILYFGSSLRGTSQYWAQRGRELRSLIQFQINEGNGLPSFFTTGSCAEYHFKPLRRLLAMYVKDTSGSDVDLTDRKQLFDTLQANTHIVAHYFDLRTQSYFKDVMGPAFGVDAYWYRQEFAKSRGMVHWHGLCWRSDTNPHNLIHEAIEEGLSDDMCAERLAAWAASEFGMTASHPAGKNDQGEPRRDLWPPPEGHAPLPAEENNPLVKLLMDVSSSQETLLEDHLLLTNRFNLHRCSDYCLQPSKSRSSNSSQKTCRMEFEKTIRPTPALVKDKNGSLRLEMERDHPVLVQHSRFHTQGWRANGDISLILSKSDPKNPSVDEIMATEKYITGYACKGNQPTGAIADLFSDMVNCADENSATGKSLCTKLLMTTVKRDVSSVEVSYELSTLPLYRSSHTFQQVSLSGLRVLERDGSTLTKSTALDKYLERQEYVTTSFYSYICNSGRVPVVSGNCTQASWPLHENYCRTMLLLHWPNWRNMAQIKDDNTSWIDKMTSFLESDDCPNFVKADVERAKQKIDERYHEEEPEPQEQDTDETPEWMDIVRPNPNFDNISTDFIYDDGGDNYDWAKTGFQYPADMGNSWLEKLNETSHLDDDGLHLPDVDISQMNDDQMFAFNIVMKTLLNFNEDNAEYEPLRMIVSGTAGSGKSFLIKCLVKSIRSLFHCNKSVGILCPTGNSANLISGVTLHSFLKIPTNKRGKEMTPPHGAIGEALQSNLTGVKILLVDERSLIGANTLGWMEFMCRCGVDAGTNYDQSWGGLPVVVFFGDDVQLPPVLDAPVYNCKSTVPAAIHGALVWQDFTAAVTLKNIIRQGDQEKQFRSVLTALREYKITPEQAKWLQKFQWNDLKLTHDEELLQRMSDRGLFVFPTHEEEWQHNKSKLLELNQTYPIAKMTAVSQGPHSKTGESAKAGGLLNTLYLCNQAKIMLSVNLCVSYGLFNGSIGRVVEIVYKNGRTPSDSLPDVVMVEFPHYTGPPFLQQYPKHVPILPVQRKVDCGCFSCKRKQIPLRLGWASTIHRCQGMTIGAGEINRYIVINPGTRSFESRNPGALFVALSRAKCTGVDNTDPDFAWHPSVLVNEDRLCHVVNTATSKARANEISRISKLSQITEEKFTHLYRDTTVIVYIQGLIDSAMATEE